MRPGYNTNGFAHHRLEDALDILAELGCESVALTVDVNAIPPPLCLSVHPRIRKRLERDGMRCVIETGARFLLDPRRKHHPTLLDPDEDAQEIRFQFLSYCIDAAWHVGADAVSFWSGAARTDESVETLFQRLADSCIQLCDEAMAVGVRLAFEPEPGMFIDTMDKYERLFHAVDHPAFGLTLDIGHLQCMG
ncbi:MAG: sugar phosphate isomerase/epimerase, partial [Gemmataceae bacterium]|nr:sugar phosphate isomerase/epimerase [Gemmataceae bacterium]